MNRLPIPSVRVDVKALEYCTGERILDGSRGTLLPTEKNVINAVGMESVLIKIDSQMNA